MLQLLMHTPRTERSPRVKSIIAASVATFIALGSAAAAAEVSEVRIAGGFGIHYLPFYVMEREKLVEKHAKAAGMPQLKASYPRISGGAALNDAVISGAADFAGAGVGPFAIVWDKTKGNMNMRALAAMGDIPMLLLTNDPRIKSLKDLRDGDRIAVPAVKASMQATLLQMAAADVFGEKGFDSVDKYTVTMRHSDATTALLAGNAVVNVHFSVAPYATRAKGNPAVREVLNSTEIVGGPMSLNLFFCSERFYKANPTVSKIVVAALSEANDIITANRSLAAQIYFESDKGAATDVKMVEDILADPNLKFTVVPHGVGKYVDFMHRTGILKNKPGSWKDLFFAEAQSLPGN